MEETITGYNTCSTDEIVCPFCGYVFGDSWEYNETDVGLIDCPECEKRFCFDLEYSVKYYTEKPDWRREWRTYNESMISNHAYREWEREHTISLAKEDDSSATKGIFG